MTDERIKLLEELPGWFWEPISLNDTWKQKYDKSLSWQIENKKAPRVNCNVESRQIQEMEIGDKKNELEKKIKLEKENGSWNSIQRCLGNDMKIKNTDSDDESADWMQVYNSRNMGSRR